MEIEILKTFTRSIDSYKQINHKAGDIVKDLSEEKAKQLVDSKLAKYANEIVEIVENNEVTNEN